MGGGKVRGLQAQGHVQKPDDERDYSGSKNPLTMKREARKKKLDQNTS